MSAYVVADVESIDQAKSARYGELVGPSIERYGGRFLARGGTLAVLEGDWNPNRVVIVEFPSLATIRDWYESDEYKEARAVREGAGTWRMVAVEGLS